MALTTRRLEPDDHALLRDLRLRSLADSPIAFGSTYEAEVELTERDWTRRLDPRGYPHFACWVDELRDGTTGSVTPGPRLSTLTGHRTDRWVPVGMVAVGHDPDEPSVAYLLGMWVDAATRGTGAADALITEALACARAQGCTAITLHVTEGNDRAERVYERHGFARTGTTYTRDRDGLQEIEMALAFDGEG